MIGKINGIDCINFKTVELQKINDIVGYNKRKKTCRIKVAHLFPTNPWTT
jgi:hypothetical protein